MSNDCSSQEEIEGKLGRRQTYTCSECHSKFQVETLSPLPNIDRICQKCKPFSCIFVFQDARTGKDTLVRAPDGELATLRAWQISRNLTLKIPQPRLVK